MHFLLPLCVSCHFLDHLGLIHVCLPRGQFSESNIDRAKLPWKSLHIREAEISDLLGFFESEDLWTLEWDTNHTIVFHCPILINVIDNAKADQHAYLHCEATGGWPYAV